jgi:DNA repair protein RadC
VTKPDSDQPHYLGHRDRLRERFLQSPEALPDYEILELLLATALPRKDVKPLAKEMIDRWGSFADVISASIDDLQETKGLGRSSATILKVVREAALRLARAPVMAKPVLSSWTDLLDYCSTAMASLKTEHFRLLFLDRKNMLIKDEVQQQGTVDHTPLYPREVVRRALELQASSIIMVHNHPTGDPTPSKADIDMTRLVRDALRTVNITLLDHLVIGRKGHCSFKSLSLI